MRPASGRTRVHKCTPGRRAAGETRSAKATVLRAVLVGAVHAFTAHVLPHAGPGLEQLPGTMEPGAEDARPAGSASPPGPGCRVQGAGCRVQGAGCRVQGAGCREQGAGYSVQGAGCSVQGAWCSVQGAVCRVVR
eukprot:gene24248-biopygen20884